MPNTDELKAPSIDADVHIASTSKWGCSRAKWALLGVNFFIETNRMEAFVAVYLITFKGWQKMWIGYVSLVMNILMLVLQTPAGDFLDKTRFKRTVTAAATLVAAVTTCSVAWTSELWAILTLKALEGVAATIFLPALMSLLLGVIPEADVPATVALTEASNKMGSVLFTVCAGVIAGVAYPRVEGVFYLLGAGGLAAAFFVMLIPATSIDDERSRQMKATKEEGEPSASRYIDLFRNKDIVMFALLTFLYHLSNAGVTPLVSQLIAHEDERTGLVFTSAVLCIFYFIQAPTSYFVVRLSGRFSYKSMLLVAHLILPVRCTTVALLAMYNRNRYALAATQVFEGLGAGIYDTLLPLLVRRLVVGTGRFGFTFGFIIACWRLGHGASLLLGESVVQASSYEAAFFTLGGLGLLVTALLAFGVRVPTSEDEPEETDEGKLYVGSVRSEPPSFRVVPGASSRLSEADQQQQQQQQQQHA
jgi:MFS family permease